MMIPQPVQWITRLAACAFFLATVTVPPPAQAEVLAAVTAPPPARAFFLAAVTVPPPAQAELLPLIDAIVVDKSLRRLYLIKDGETVRTFEIALGLAPEGRKLREGDYRTPEGEYYISGRKPDSSFMLALQISYPNAADRARAAAAEVPAGGLIMVHGRPVRPINGRDRNYYAKRDWTDGCIAVNNAAMLEIWMMTRIGTPITIKP